ncbi:hypothetical protein A9X75_07335 [Brachyspira hyodysenteriae]|nr:hypothetical protein A9X75_07335 [Brachyspira hyodysenteriae]TVL69169.1 hypothetical protein A9X74_10895 [Brachyspira hyodysenteriae]TVL70271.1 hypothetical protein A9X76_03665 [Brachyspira hyodysenteriae]TVL83445.1 hypothetical protein A9X82_11580 [Brachyspira hyodysenteriae]
MKIFKFVNFFIQLFPAAHALRTSSKLLPQAGFACGNTTGTSFGRKRSGVWGKAPDIKKKI